MYHVRIPAENFVSTQEERLMKDIPDFEKVQSYYDSRICEHGATPLGCGYNSEEAQTIRFDQLLKVVETQGSFSLLDYGCGYGALADYLMKKGYKAEYLGYDVLESAIESARKAHAGKPSRSFSSDKSQLPVCDYTVASGIFNFLANPSLDVWTEYVISVLHEFDELNKPVKFFCCFS